MATETLLQRSRLTESVWRIANHLIVAGLLACAVWPVIQIGQRIALGWDGSYLVPAAALVAVEAMLAERLSQRRGGSLGLWLLVWRAAEFGVILLLVRLFQVARAAAGVLGTGVVALVLRLLAQARGDALPPGVSAPGEGLITPEFVFAGVLLFLVWSLAGLFAAGLLAMEGDDSLLQDRDRNLVLAAERAAARQHMRGLIFTVGAGMLVLTAVLRADLSRMGVTWTPFNGGAWNLILYFALGLLLLGQSRFAGLRLQWAWERIAVRPGLAWGWAGYSLALVLLVAVVASVLPTRYSVGLLDVLAGLLNLIGVALYWLSWLIFVPLGAFLAWLQSLASPNSSAPPPAEILPPPALPRAPVTPSNPGGWTAWSESLVFWLLFLGVFAVSFLFLVRQRPEVEQLLRRLALPWPWLAERWRAVWAAGRRLRQEVARLAQAGLDRLRPSGPPPSAPWRYLNVRRLQPRERVRFYYQALLRRGRETGWPRRPGETPLEYEQNLAEALPEAQTPLADLTGEFLSLNLALAVHERTKLSTIAAEMRPSQGTWAIDLKLTNPEGLNNLIHCRAADITTTVVEKELVRTTFGVRLLLASSRARETDQLNYGPQMEAILQQLSMMAQMVILDIGTSFHPMLDRILSQLNEIIVITEPQPSSVERTRLLIDDLVARGFGKPKLLTVMAINRVRADVVLSANQIQEKIGQSIAMMVPPAPEQAFYAATRSIPLIEIQKEGLVSQQFYRMADMLAQRLQTQG